MVYLRAELGAVIKEYLGGLERLDAEMAGMQIAKKKQTRVKLLIYSYIHLFIIIHLFFHSFPHIKYRKRVVYADAKLKQGGSSCFSQHKYV